MMLRLAPVPLFLLASLLNLGGAAAQEVPVKAASPAEDTAPEKSVSSTDSDPAPAASEAEATPAQPNEDTKNNEGKAQGSEDTPEETAKQPQPTEASATEADTQKTDEVPPPTYENDYAAGGAGATTALVKDDKVSPFILGLLWDMSLPMGTTRDFVGKLSARGFTVDGRYRGLGNVGLGFSVSWHLLDERTKSTATWDSTSITGTQIREVSSSPFTFKVSYALRDQKEAVPYVGLGIGGARVLRRIDMGISRVTDESWHFALVPELGVEVPTKAVVLLASTRFNYFFKSGDAPAQLYTNFSLGVGFD